MHSARIGYDAFGIAVTENRCGRSAVPHGFGAILHNEMKLYTAEQIPPIAWI